MNRYVTDTSYTPAGLTVVARRSMERTRCSHTKHPPPLAQRIQRAKVEVSENKNKGGLGGGALLEVSSTTVVRRTKNQFLSVGFDRLAAGGGRQRPGPRPGHARAPVHCSVRCTWHSAAHCRALRHWVVLGSTAPVQPS